MTPELRQCERTPLDHPVVFTGMDREGTIRVRGVGRALDISPNGLMLETRAPIREERIRVRITVSDGRSIAMDGELIYSIPHRPQAYRTGVKIAGARETISEFIADLQGR